MEQWIPDHTRRAVKALDAMLQPEPRQEHQPQPQAVPIAEPKIKRSFFARFGALFGKN